MQQTSARRDGGPMTEPIVVIGEDGALRDALEREVASLPAPTLAALDLDEAAERAGALDRPPAVVLVPAHAIDPDRFEASLARLRVRSGAERLVPIAFGRQPDEARRRALRDAGVELALFGRFGRNALRFQLNRALAPGAGRWARGELRAPKEWRTRAFAAGREKSVRCYSLSSAGVYLVTPRPWIVGADIDLDLPVGADRLRLSGRIVYTRTGSEHDRSLLPRGMAVAFRPLCAHVQAVIRQDVTATQASLRV